VFYDITLPSLKNESQKESLESHVQTNSKKLKRKGTTKNKILNGLQIHAELSHGVSPIVTVPDEKLKVTNYCHKKVK